LNVERGREFRHWNQKVYYSKYEQQIHPSDYHRILKIGQRDVADIMEVQNNFLFPLVAIQDE
jgi:hypothetical protein